MLESTSQMSLLWSWRTTRISRTSILTLKESWLAMESWTS